MNNANDEVTVMSKTRATRQLFKGKWSMEPDGTEEYYYVIHASAAGLRALAAQAAKNKGGKAVDGPLTARIVERRKI